MSRRISFPELINLAIGTPDMGNVNFNALRLFLHRLIEHLHLQEVKSEVTADEVKLIKSPLSTVSPSASTEMISVTKKPSSVFHQMHERIAAIERQLNLLKETPPTDDLLARSQGTAQPAMDMWQMMMLKKKMEVNEEGITKAMQTLQDLLNNISFLQTASDTFQEELGLLKKDVSRLNVEEIKDRILNFDEQARKIGDMKEQLDLVNEKVCLAEDATDLVRWSSLYKTLTRQTSLEEDFEGQEEDFEGQEEDFEGQQKDSKVQQKDSKGQQKDIIDQRKDSKVQRKDSKVQQKDIIDQRKDSKVQQKESKGQQKDIIDQRRDSKGQQKDSKDQRKDSKDQQKDSKDQQKDSKDQQKDSKDQQKDSKDQQKDIIDQQKDSKGQQKDSKGQQKDSKDQQKDSKDQQKDSKGQQKDIIDQQKDSKGQQKDIIDQQKDSKGQQKDSKRQQKDSKDQQKDSKDQQKDSKDQQKDSKDQQKDSRGQEKDSKSQQKTSRDILAMLGQLPEKYEVLLGHFTGLESQLKEFMALDSQLKQSGGIQAIPEMKSLMDQVKMLQNQNMQRQDSLQSALVQVEKLKEQYGTLQRGVDKLVRSTSDIQVMRNMLQQLDVNKADKTLIQEEMRVKADKSALETKVSQVDLETATSQLSDMMHDLLQKMSLQDKDWQKALEKLFVDMDCKLDRMALDPVSQQLEEVWRFIKKYLSEGPRFDADSAAGFKKQLFERVKCISCDRPVTLMTGPHMITIRKATLQSRPATASGYEHQQRKDQEPMEMNDNIPLPTCWQCQVHHQACSLRHLSRTQDLATLYPYGDPTAITYDNTEVDILGVNGVLYKGRVSSHAAERAFALQREFAAMKPPRPPPGMKMERVRSAFADVSTGILFPQLGRGTALRRVSSGSVVAQSIQQQEQQLPPWESVDGTILSVGFSQTNLQNGGHLADM